MKKDFEDIQKTLSEKEKEEFTKVLSEITTATAAITGDKIVYGGVRLVEGMKGLMLSSWDVATPQEGGNQFPVFTFDNGARTGLRNLSNASGWNEIANRPPMPSSKDELNHFLAWCIVKKVCFDVLSIRSERRNNIDRTVVVFRVYLKK